MIVYFDTNVFDHLQQHNQGVTEWDLYRIQRAVKHGYVRLVFSSLCIEETLFIIKSKPQRANARMKLILELADKQLFARGQEMIMNNDIQSYAHGIPPLSPFISLDPGIEFNIRNLAKQELDDLLDETRRDKTTFQDFLDEGKTKMRPMADAIRAKRYPFDHYWANNSRWLAEGLADCAGVLAEVKQRGVDGLRKVKSVAVAVGANLSLLYSHHFENRAPDSGDSRDMLHALVASTADIFVTNDEGLEKVLARIPAHGFWVMSLRAFLESLPNWV